MAEYRDNGSTGGAPEVEAGGERQGVGGWIGGVFTDPKSTFEAIAARLEVPHPTDPERTVDRTRWWIPVLIMAVVAVGVAVYTVPNFVLPMQAEAIRAAIADRGLPPEQAEQAISMARGFALPSAILGSAVGTFVMLFVVAGILHLLMRMVGGKGRFRAARAVVAYSMLVSAVGSIVKVPLMAVKKSMFVETSLALMAQDLERSSKLYKLLNGFDIFTIWWVVLLIMGLAISYRLPRPKAAMIVVLLWLVVLVIGMYIPTGGAFGASG